MVVRRGQAKSTALQSVSVAFYAAQAPLDLLSPLPSRSHSLFNLQQHYDLCQREVGSSTLSLCILLYRDRLTEHMITDAIVSLSDAS
jgi:hypothetical protein